MMLTLVCDVATDTGNNSSDAWTTGRPRRECSARGELRRSARRELQTGQRGAAATVAHHDRVGPGQGGSRGGYGGTSAGALG